MGLGCPSQHGTSFLEQGNRMLFHQCFPEFCKLMGSGQGFRVQDLEVIVKAPGRGGLELSV